MITEVSGVFKALRSTRDVSADVQDTRYLKSSTFNIDRMI